MLVMWDPRQQRPLLVLAAEYTTLLKITLDKHLLDDNNEKINLNVCNACKTGKCRTGPFILLPV